MTDADRAITDSADREEQRSRLTLSDLERDGPAIRLRDLCAVTGFSKMKFLNDIERGILDVRRVATGDTHVVLVEREEARRYLTAIGFAA